MIIALIFRSKLRGSKDGLFHAH